MESKSPRRRRLRITLRLSMALVLVLGILMGWQVNKARKQKEAVAAVKASGGSVRYHWEFVNGKLAKGTQPNAPKWMRRLLGDEFFQEIVQVNLHTTVDNSTGKRHELASVDRADDLLALLGNHQEIRMLSLQGRQVTDESLRSIGQLENLEHLQIFYAGRVTDDGIAHLVGLKVLNSIHIDSSQMSDRGLAILASLPRLENLSLQGHHFSDAGLASLKDMTNLKRLHVGQPRIHVDSFEARITDRGIAYLKNLTDLIVLDIKQSAVTDKGLEELKGLSKLKMIYLSQAATTRAGRESLKAAIPNLMVIP